MRTRQQWTVMGGVGTTAVFGIALAIQLRQQIDLLEIGSKAPTFNATDLRTNRPAGIADYRGKVVLLNIWATWCLPCRAEMPSMEKLCKKLAGTDFRIAAVSVDGDPFHLEGSEDQKGIMAFATNLGLTFDILHDPSGAIRQAYDIFGVPESYLIDRNGVIVKRVIGAADWEEPVNEMLIRRLLSEH